MYNLRNKWESHKLPLIPTTSPIEPFDFFIGKPLKVVQSTYNSKQDCFMTFREVIQISTRLGLCNFGNLTRKYLNFEHYFLPFLSKKNINNINQLVKAIPGDDYTQTPLCFFLFKTNNILYSLLGLVLVVFPGIIFNILLTILLKYLSEFGIIPSTINKSLEKTFIEITWGILCLHMIEWFNITAVSPFHSGLVFITSILSFISDNLVFLTFLLILSCYWSIKKIESQFWVINITSDFLHLINAKIKGMNLRSLILMLWLFVIILFVYLSSNGDLSKLMFGSYWYGLMIWNDFTIINMLYFFQVVDTEYTKLLTCVGISLLLPGSHWNWYINLLFFSGCKKLVFLLIATLWLYLPSIWLLLFIIPVIPELNDNVNIVNWFKGLKSGLFGLFWNWLLKASFAYVSSLQSFAESTISVVIILTVYFLFYKPEKIILIIPLIIITPFLHLVVC